MIALLDPTAALRRAALLRTLPAREWARRRAPDRLAIRRRASFVTTAAGYRVAVTTTEPDDDRPRAAVVLVPGRQGDSRSWEGLCLLRARELAARGLRALAFDPVGRGESWGHDDFGGHEGQDGLRAVLDLVRGDRSVRPGAVVVLSLSVGLALAAPVLVREGTAAGVAALVDWEGPGDRQGLLRPGALPPAARAALAADPDRFWAIREPIRWVGQLRVPWHRIQAREDHAGGARATEASLALVAEALRGGAPSVRLNDNAPNVAWRWEQRDRISWAPQDPGALHGALMQAVLDAAEGA